MLSGSKNLYSTYVEPQNLPVFSIKNFRIINIASFANDIYQGVLLSGSKNLYSIYVEPQNLPAFSAIEIVVHKIPQTLQTVFIRKFSIKNFRIINIASFANDIYQGVLLSGSKNLYSIYVEPQNLPAFSAIEIVVHKIPQTLQTVFIRKF